MREILGDDDRKWAEELASILLETAKELSQRTPAVSYDPKARGELEAAYKKLTAFDQYLRKHPLVHTHLPRETAGSERVSDVVAGLLQRFKGALNRLPKTKNSSGPAEAARRWMGFAVVSALKSRRIQISQFENGKAALILEAGCALLGLPKIERKRLREYIRADTGFAPGLSR